MVNHLTIDRIDQSHMNKVITCEAMNQALELADLPALHSSIQLEVLTTIIESFILSCKFLKFYFIIKHNFIFSLLLNFVSILPLLKVLLAPHSVDIPAPAGQTALQLGRPGWLECVVRGARPAPAISWSGPFTHTQTMHYNVSQ